MDTSTQDTPHDRWFNGNPRLMAEAGTLAEFKDHKKIWIGISDKEKDALLKKSAAVAAATAKKLEKRADEADAKAKKIADKKPVLNKKQK